MGGLDPPYLEKVNYSLMVSMKQAINEKDRRKIIENILEVCINEKEDYKVYRAIHPLKITLLDLILISLFEVLLGKVLVAQVQYKSQLRD